mmetsp:Transcript_16341/g.33429  ORF Transcript_16341/g.33429 Transcript_16341/m.33429 type:complete len:90 (+) Transcript_16341:395-664(+)
MFPSLTLERIESFAAGYRDSEEEKGHILEAYKEHAGIATSSAFYLGSVELSVVSLPPLEQRNKCGMKQWFVYILRVVISQVTTTWFWTR